MSTIIKTLLNIASATVSDKALLPARIESTANAPKTESTAVATAPAPSPAHPTPQAEPAPLNRINIPITCSKTGKLFVLRYRKNRYSGKIAYDSTITEFPEGSGPPPVVESFDIADFDFSAVRCPHCKAGFAEGGPIKCARSHFACRAGVSSDGGYFRCCAQCGERGRLTNFLKTIDGSASASPARRAPPTSTPQLASTPPPRLLKGPQQ